MGVPSDHRLQGFILVSDPRLNTRLCPARWGIIPPQTRQICVYPQSLERINLKELLKLPGPAYRFDLLPFWHSCTTPYLPEVFTFCKVRTLGLNRQDYKGLLDAYSQPETSPPKEIHLEANLPDVIFHTTLRGKEMEFCSASNQWDSPIAAFCFLRYLGN